MKYLVCKFKDDGTLFITTRQSRERMISVLIDLQQEIESVVEKEFDTYAEALKYKTDIEKSNDLINKIIG